MRLLNFRAGDELMDEVHTGHELFFLLNSVEDQRHSKQIIKTHSLEHLQNTSLL
jgi:hypothetical protein